MMELYTDPRRTDHSANLWKLKLLCLIDLIKFKSCQIYGSVKKYFVYCFPKNDKKIVFFFTVSYLFTIFFYLFSLFFRENQLFQKRKVFKIPLNIFKCCYRAAAFPSSQPSSSVINRGSSAKSTSSANKKSSPPPPALVVPAYLLHLTELASSLNSGNASSLICVEDVTPARRRSKRKRRKRKGEVKIKVGTSRLFGKSSIY
jgi:hypothetical protein